MHSSFAALAAGALLLLTGCGVETVVHDLNEREANQIVEVLADRGITASKMRVQEGRNVVFQISVPSSVRLDAIKILNQNELPRRRDRGYQEVFQESGLIPTSAEERAKKLAALEGEIERQLKLIEGILDTQVQIVMPEDSALRTTQDAVPPTTASVTIKYMPDAQGKSPLSDQQVRTLVANGVEKLNPENVFVVLTPAIAVTKKVEVEATGGTWVHKLARKQLNMLAVAILGLILLLGVALVFAQVRLRTVRGRLIRLQTEIAKARRKPAEGLPSD